MRLKLPSADLDPRAADPTARPHEQPPADPRLPPLKAFGVPERTPPKKKG